MNSPILLCVAGYSATGKSTLISELVKRQRLPIKRVVTTTTRPKRLGEKQKISYHFIDKERFLTMKAQGRFIETATIAGHFYGTEKASLQKTLKGQTIAAIAVDQTGYRKLKKSFPNTLLLFLTAKKSTLLKRLRERGTPKAELEKRLARLPKEKSLLKKADIILSTDHILAKHNAKHAEQALRALLK